MISWDSMVSMVFFRDVIGINWNFMGTIHGNDHRMIHQDWSDGNIQRKVFAMENGPVEINFQ